jgi:hypothetical protein
VCPCGGNVHVVFIIIANAKQQILLQFQGVVSIALWQWATNLCLMSGGLAPFQLKFTIFHLVNVKLLMLV